ncbi:hypothetical protein BCR44DRAFT_1084957 [Catenaria anguillulae PL171]|uniref:Uncharacterized protein n=1 Tax=Catenaria anguillulae PL171 TaxID=765915 RepID=A0A1Y2HNS0_9FUNG|nr:hypothetical protein BCR44DRAFT_1084957 [Catenaria anguillulae PL171]
MSRGDGPDASTPGSTAARRVGGSDQMEVADNNVVGSGLGGRSYMRLKSISFLGSKTKNSLGRISFSLRPKEHKDPASGSTTPNSGGKSRPNGGAHHPHHQQQQHKNAHKLQMLRIESHLVRRGMWVIASFSISWAFILCQIMWAFSSQRRIPVDLEIAITLAAFFSPLLDPLAIMYVDVRWRDAMFGLFPSCCCRRRRSESISAHRSGA